jgi:hypothetical protein
VSGVPWWIKTGSVLDDLDLLTPSFTVTLNYNQLHQLTINACLKLTPFLTRIRMSSFQSFFYCDWLGSDLRIGHFFSVRCPLANTPQLNTQPESTTELPSEFTSDWITAGSINYVSSFYNFWTNRIEITISNSSRYCVLIRCCGDVSIDPLLSNACPSTVDSVNFGTCLLYRCLSMVIFVTICR